MEKFITIKEAQEITSLSRSTLHNMAKRQELVPVTIRGWRKPAAQSGEDYGHAGKEVHSAFRACFVGA